MSAFVLLEQPLEPGMKMLLAENFSRWASARGRFLVVGGDGDFYGVIELADGTVMSSAAMTEDQVAVALARPAMEQVRVALERGRRTAAGSAPSPAVSFPGGQARGHA